MERGKQLRLDKFLKISRLVKRRTVANEACDSGKVLVNQKVARASYTVKENDIITFLYDDDYVTHRVVKIDGNKVITRGDANNVYDVSVSSDKVVGRVVSIWKNVGVWQRVLFSPRVLIMFIVTLILCVFAS